MIFIVFSKMLLALVPVRSRKQQNTEVAAAERWQDLWGQGIGEVETPLI